MIIYQYIAEYYPHFYHPLAQTRLMDTYVSGTHMKNLFTVFRSTSQSGTKQTISVRLKSPDFLISYWQNCVTWFDNELSLVESLLLLQLRLVKYGVYEPGMFVRGNRCQEVKLIILNAFVIIYLYLFAIMKH